MSALQLQFRYSAVFSPTVTATYSTRAKYIPGVSVIPSTVRSHPCMHIYRETVSKYGQTDPKSLSFFSKQDAYISRDGQ